MRDRTRPALEKLKALVPNDRNLQEIFGLQVQLANSQFFNAGNAGALSARPAEERWLQFALREAPYWQ